MKPGIDEGTYTDQKDKDRKEDVNLQDRDVHIHNPHRENDFRMRILIAWHFFSQMSSCFKGKDFLVFNVLVPWRKCKLNLNFHNL